MVDSESALSLAEGISEGCDLRAPFICIMSNHLNDIHDIDSFNSVENIERVLKPLFSEDVKALLKAAGLS